MTAFRDFIVNDWWIAIPMFLMSLTAITLVIWRILLNMNATTKMGAFLPAFQQKLEKEGAEAALAMCRKREDIIPRRLFAAGLEVSKQGMSAARRAMANAIELEILPDLNFLLPTILGIAKIATMVGLFGTVVSMIDTFNKIGAAQGGGGAAGHAKGIGLALFATALGLITAIPLVFAHVQFKAWISHFEVEMKKAAQKLLLLLQATKGSKSAAAASSAPTAAPASSPPVPLASSGGTVRR